MKKAFICAALAMLPSLSSVAYASDGDKIALVKQVMSQIDDRIDIITQNATDDFLEVIEMDNAVTPDGFMNCTQWDWIGGNDPSQSEINQSISYRVLDDGDVRVKFKYAGLPYETLDFVIVESDGRYLIDDIYSLDQDTYFRLSTAECWAESGYI